MLQTQEMIPILKYVMVLRRRTIANELLPTQCNVTSRENVPVLVLYGKATKRSQTSISLSTVIPCSGTEYVLGTDGSEFDHPKKEICICQSGTWLGTILTIPASVAFARASL